MPTLHKLSALQVQNAAPGKYNDGGGLWLVRRKDGGGHWTLRLTMHGRRREMGLGSTSEVSLKEARKQAEAARALVRDGKDPIKERERRRREAARRAHTLADVTVDCFEARKAALKDDGKAARWMGPLEGHTCQSLDAYRSPKSIRSTSRASCRRSGTRSLKSRRRLSSGWGLSSSTAQAMSGLGDAHYARARMKRALDYFERCSALCREHGFGKIAVGSLHMSAVVRRYRNECRRALEDIRRATAMAVAVGNVRSEMVTLTITAEMSADAGDLKSAFPALDRAQALAERLGARRYAAYIRYQLGRALWQDGERRAEAASVLEEAVAISEETGRHFIGPRALAALALATSANDEVWRRHLALGESILEDGCLAHNVLWFRRDAMEAALAAGDAATARRHADALAAYTRAEPLPWCDFFIARSRALADALEGRSRATSGAAFAELRRQAEAIGLFSAAPALEMAEARSA